MDNDKRDEWKRWKKILFGEIQVLQLEQKVSIQLISVVHNDSKKQTFFCVSLTKTVLFAYSIKLDSNFIEYVPLLFNQLKYIKFIPKTNIRIVYVVYTTFYFRYEIRILSIYKLTWSIVVTFHLYIGSKKSLRLKYFQSHYKLIKYEVQQ